MDETCLSNNAIFIAFLQITLVGWVFGMDRFLTCVEKMGMQLKEGTKLYFKISLKFICPLCMLVLFLMNFIGYFKDYSGNYTKHRFIGTKNHTGTRDYLSCNGKILNHYDCMYEMKEIEFLSWMIELFTVMFIPLGMAYEIFKNYKAGNPWKTLISPKENWRPADEDYNPREGLKHTYF